MTQIAESTVKKILILLVIAASLLLRICPTPTAQAAITYQYIIDGPLDEATADWLTGSMTVTAHINSGGASANPVFSVPSATTYLFNSSYPVIYFAFDYNGTGTNQHREWYLTSNELGNTSKLYRGWFSNNSLTNYAISFLDYTGQLKSYQYITVESYLLGVTTIVSVVPVDSQNLINVNLVPGTHYKISYGDGVTSYVYGDVTPTSLYSNIQLIMRGLKFPEKTLLLYQYVHAYAYRDFLDPYGAITINYEDTQAHTNSVNITITNASNGAVFFSNIYTAQTLNFVITNVPNATSYQVIFTIDHATYGTFYYKQYLLGEYTKPSLPFSLDFLGTSTFIPTTFLIPALLIIFVAGCFSEVTSEAAAIIVVIIAIVLAALGFIEISQSAIVVALSLSLMSAIVVARRRFT